MHYEGMPFHRAYRIAMTDEERAAHQPGTGVDPETFTLNRTRSLAETWEPRNRCSCGGPYDRGGYCLNCRLQRP